jgi:hypothetical protein
MTVTRKSDTIDCSTSNPDWTFHDLVDFFHIRGQTWLDAAGDPIRSVEHVEHIHELRDQGRDRIASHARAPTTKRELSSPERGTLERSASHVGVARIG